MILIFLIKLIFETLWQWFYLGIILINCSYKVNNTFSLIIVTMELRGCYNVKGVDNSINRAYFVIINISRLYDEITESLFLYYKFLKIFASIVCHEFLDCFVGSCIVTCRESWLLFIPHYLWKSVTNKGDVYYKKVVEMFNFCWNEWALAFPPHSRSFVTTGWNGSVTEYFLLTTNVFWFCVKFMFTK